MDTFSDVFTDMFGDSSGTTVQGGMVSQLTFPTAPGTTVNLAAATGGSGNPAPNAITCMVGISDRGPVIPTQVLDLLDYQRKYGSRNAAAATLSDAVELAFAEGAFTVWVNRVTGPTPTKGTIALVDRNGTPVLTMTVTAAWPGSQSANLSIGIATGTVANSFDLSVYDTSSPNPTVAVENFRDNTTVAMAVAAINTNSAYITAVDNASSSSGTAAFPALLTGVGTVLSAGTDDRTNATDTQWAAAAGAFAKDLGGGTLCAPGRYTSAFHLLLMSAAVAQQRLALLDGPPLPAAADLTSLALADSVGAGYLDAGDSAMGFGPWLLIPPAPGGNVSRQVPMSAGVAGLIALNDAKSGHSNQASMGKFGNFAYATGLSVPSFSASDRTLINGRQGTAGWNVARQVPGSGPQLFGFRTVAQAIRAYFGANIRETLTLDRAISVIGDNYIGSIIDGQAKVFMDLANDISALLREHFDLNALYGQTSAQAYGVDVGQTVNTPQSILAGVIRARVWFIPSPTGEKVLVDLVRQSVPTS